MYSDATSFCTHLSVDELDLLSDGSKPVSLSRGDTLDNRELETWPILAISSGVIGMQHLLEDGRKTIAAFFMQGDIIDLREMQSHHRGQLIALKNAGVCRLAPQIFRQITASNPAAQNVIWSNLRQQTYRAMDHSADLAKKHALEKLASFIFECRNRQVMSFAKNIVVIPVRRVDLAEYLGMQPETVSRCFKDLEARGIIELQSISNIRVVQIPTLRRIANGDRYANGLVDDNDKGFKVLHFG